MGELIRRPCRRRRPRRRRCCRRRRHRLLRAATARGRATRPGSQAACKRGREQLVRGHMCTCTRARTHARLFTRMLTSMRANVRARVHACVRVHMQPLPSYSLPPLQAACSHTCESSQLWGTRAQRRMGCRARACGGAACCTARPGLGRAGQLVLQAALSSYWHLCSATGHGRRRECAGCAGRAARLGSVPGVAAVRDADVVMLCGRVGRVGSTNKLFLSYQKER